MFSVFEKFPFKNPVPREENSPWLIALSTGSMSEKSHRAYQLYSIFYAPLALLAYYVIWKGRLLKHIQFFRDTLEKHPLIIDLATGDGTLTKKALFPFWRQKVEGLLVLDISESMLAKAVKKLPKKKTIFVQADVMDLPFQSDSVDCLTCFGGFNSFASGKEAMREMARVLKQGGILRGSVLLTPKKRWKRRIIGRFIDWGLQTEQVDMPKFLQWIDKAGLSLTESFQHGDVLLFEVVK